MDGGGVSIMGMANVDGKNGIDGVIKTWNRIGGGVKILVRGGVEKKGVATNVGKGVGMAMGRDGDGFYLPRPHTLLPNTYMLPYPYPTGIRNRIASLSPTGSGIPTPSPSPIVNKLIFYSRDG
ncbi:hypothetical protein MTR_8g078920 [Medicago truncatula]|uniref:Uncharacterized protein n=1 Tax=Medicago truncatula TaxID=3880 RepID=G7ZVI0_MEDTR|nr:hypothetical protein MTR_8g078920 [Medicago truncatula]